MSTTATHKGILCGNCKGRHSTVDEVKACYGMVPLTADNTDRALASLEIEKFIASHNLVNSSSFKAKAIPVAQRSHYIPADDRIPAGHYVVATEEGDKFYHVSHGKGKWDGYTFLEVQASDEYWPIKNKSARDNVFAMIREQGVLECLARYGFALGRCGICNRTLTRPESIAAGIGPVCAAGL